MIPFTLSVITTAHLSVAFAPEHTGIGSERTKFNRALIRLASAPEDTSKPSVYEYNGQCHRFNGEVFAKSNCWGRRPFLMRGAFDPGLLLDKNICGDDNSWPTWDDVVDIASDDDSESRVISHKPGDEESYELLLGPLSESDVNEWVSKASTSKSRERKTLVVNDVDRFYPRLADWIHNNFRFLPNWRMDDGQISLSEEMGGIGPHVDNYDVFLIQMTGTKLWQVGLEKLSAKDEMDRTVNGLDVRVLDRWGANTEFEDFTLNPGDLLYLPPRIAHSGTALTTGCMTLSVGCRAPSVSDLISRLAENLSSSIEENAVRRYVDEDLLDGDAGVFSPGLLTETSKHQARQLVLDSLLAMLGDDVWWDEFFGKYATEQKRVRLNYPVPLGDVGFEESEAANDIFANAEATIRSVLDGQAVLYHAEGITFAYSTLPKNEVNQTVHRLFTNGEMWQSQSETSKTKNDCMGCLFQAVANHRKLDSQLLLSCIGGDLQCGRYLEAVKFLQELVTLGVLYAGES
ncbi:hypothetical protein HJC23_012088 [Cyclotella cryptica]|uniref:Bifunctional lysine-specific demethylase and histidyl-hydroxylase n=1 Tax=Cyclotella cryptica TaxID=29204 RepID=A0ABD3PTG1_9STRA